ncbi:MAG: DUF1501 domain-containing protein [Bryobacteraceae bacterium]
MNRRSFLRTITLAAGWQRFSRLPLLAQGDDYRALVCVFLYGGNDCNNTVVPLDAAAFRTYQSSRGTLALSQQSLLPVEAPGGAAYGLHPRLTDVQRLYRQGKAAIVANVGVLVRPTSRDEYRRRLVSLPVNLFSHSDQQLQWQSADPSGGSRSGWGGRTVDQVKASELAAVSLSGVAAFLNSEQVRATLINPGAPTSLTGFSNTREQQARLQAFLEILELEDGNLLVSATGLRAREGIRISQTLTRILTGSSPFKTAFPATTLGRQLEAIARLINARRELAATRQVFFASLGGWDLHVNLLASHDPLLGQLNAALAAFYQATEEMGVADRVTAFTASEFGRTLNPNANAGSDHGWGGHHFVIGGAVKGGTLYGSFPTVAPNSPDDATGRGVWIPTTSLEQYGATLAAWFGVPDERLEKVFPNVRNFTPNNLGFLV